MDIEELARQGRAKGVCPYYAARAAAARARLVLLPYGALLSPARPTPARLQGVLPWARQECTLGCPANPVLSASSLLPRRAACLVTAPALHAQPCTAAPSHPP